MTDTPPEPTQASENRKKKVDKDKAAHDAAKVEAIRMAEAEGVDADPSWTLGKIESATLKAMVANEAARVEAMMDNKAARVKAAKAPVVAPAAPALVQSDADAEIRKEIIQTAHEAGMDLEDLKGRPTETILEMIGKHLGAAAIKGRTEVPLTRVQVRVLKKGDNKISKGIHIPGIGDICHKAGDVIAMSSDSASVLEERGFVEIQA